LVAVGQKHIEETLNYETMESLGAMKKGTFFQLNIIDSGHVASGN